MWYVEEKDDIPLRNVILPMEFGVKHLPKIFVKDSAVDPLCHGAPLALPGVSKYSDNFKTSEIVAIYTLKNELVALGEAQFDSSYIEGKEQGIIAKIKRVLMPLETYPSKKKED